MINPRASATHVASLQSHGSTEQMSKTSYFNLRGSGMFFPEPAESATTRGESYKTRQKTAQAVEQNKVLLKKPKPHKLNPKLN